MTTTTNPKRELTLSRLIDAPRDKVFRAWTEPELIKQWFTPRAWTSWSTCAAEAFESKRWTRQTSLQF